MTFKNMINNGNDQQEAIIIKAIRIIMLLNWFYSILSEEVFCEAHANKRELKGQ